MSKSYKAVQRETTLSAAIGDGFSELECLAEECRELVDNATDMSRGTQRIQTFEETADTLESLTQPDDPSEVLGTLPVSYVEMVHRSKKARPSRAVRQSNALDLLRAAAMTLQIWLDDHEEWADQDDVRSVIDTDTSPSCAEVHGEATDLMAELENLVAEAENCEFPGMFG